MVVSAYINIYKDGRVCVRWKCINYKHILVSERKVTGVVFELCVLWAVQGVDGDQLVNFDVCNEGLCKRMKNRLDAER